MDEVKMVVEGVYSAKAAMTLARNTRYSFPSSNRSMRCFSMESSSPGGQ